MSKTRAKRSTQLIDWLTRNKKIVYWLNIDWSRRTKRSTVDCRCNKLIDWLIFRTKKINFWLSFSQTHDHFRWLTIRIVKYIHRFQRENFTFWRFSFDSRISTSDSTIFFWTLAYLYERWRFCFYSLFLRATDDFL